MSDPLRTDPARPGLRLSRRGMVLSVLALAACGGRPDPAPPRMSLLSPNLHPGETPEMRRKVDYWAAQHQIPPALLHRVIQRESGYRPEARNGPYYGLMQIMPQTARTMGYTGPATGLLDADTNLKYAGRYLRGAYLVADRNQDAAIGWYARGYYYEAKRKGLLKETGLRA
ncbi:lytic transglycosylase domain-containing protein [Paracoccus jeotgali]|nr:lytic transglycosylase domain-containing protein [Paracoccus jeotgali]